MIYDFVINDTPLFSMTQRSATAYLLNVKFVGLSGKFECSVDYWKAAVNYCPVA